MEVLVGTKTPRQPHPLDEEQQIPENDPIDGSLTRIKEQFSLMSAAELEAREVQQAKEELDMKNV